MKNQNQNPTNNQSNKHPQALIKAGGGKSNKIDIREEITNDIIELLESGDVDFNLGFDFRDGLPMNAATGQFYSGVNIFKLSMEKRKSGYLRNKWLTFKQAQELGGHVRKGETGVRAIKYGSYDVKVRNTTKNALEYSTGSNELAVVGESNSGSDKRVFVNSFVLFNIQQIDGIEWDFAEHEILNIDVIDSLIRSLNIRIESRQEAPFFSPDYDFISMPHKGSFESTEFYYAALLHEVTHWTGHKSRLNRDFEKRFETDAYAFEELVAELGAAMLGGMFGIYKPISKNHAGYIAHWIKILKGDKGAFITAASKAWEATNFIKSELDKIVDSNNSVLSIN